MNSNQTHQQLLKDLTDVRKKLIKKIKNALAYMNGGNYVDGMAMCRIVNALKGNYGSDKMEGLIKKASIDELQQTYQLLNSWGFIELGNDRARELKSGVEFCPHCGGRL